jgi:translocation and assembly module TamB
VPRRRLVVLASALAIFALGLIAAILVFSATQTDYGRAKIRNIALGLIAPKVRGKIYIGKISGSVFTGVTIDSVEIRDVNDSLFVATGPIAVRYDPRDIWDKRLLFQSVEIQRPVVVLRRDTTNAPWNYKRIFVSGPSKPKVGGQHGLGDFIVADTAVVRNGTLTVVLPWSPNDSLKNAKRDSAIAFNLKRKDKEIRRGYPGRFSHTYRWTGVQIDLSRARIADPDTTGRVFFVSRLDADETEPPFAFRNVRGQVRNLADSVWLELPHFDLPASTGRASGKVTTGKGPVQYDLTVVGDSVALNDVAWVYPTLPTTGGGKMKLRIKSERDPNIIDYTITDMDVRSTKSHLIGDMTFAVGAPVLVVKDVDMRAEPLDFDLIRRLAGGPFPCDWQGRLVGTARGKGGPLNKFAVDDARMTFYDARLRDFTASISTSTSSIHGPSNT